MITDNPSKVASRLISKNSPVIISESGHHKHHISRKVRHIAVISSVVIGTTLICIFVPQVSLVAIQGAVSIIGTSF